MIQNLPRLKENVLIYGESSGRRRERQRVKLGWWGQDSTFNLSPLINQSGNEDVSMHKEGSKHIRCWESQFLFLCLPWLNMANNRLPSQDWLNTPPEVWSVLSHPREPTSLSRNAPELSFSLDNFSTLGFCLLVPLATLAYRNGPQVASLITHLLFTLAF